MLKPVCSILESFLSNSCHIEIYRHNGKLWRLKNDAQICFAGKTGLFQLAALYYFNYSIMIIIF